MLQLKTTSLLMLLYGKHLLYTCNKPQTLKLEFLASIRIALIFQQDNPFINFCLEYPHIYELFKVLVQFIIDICMYILYIYTQPFSLINYLHSYIREPNVLQSDRQNYYVYGTFAFLVTTRVICIIYVNGVLNNKGYIIVYKFIQSHSTHLICDQEL